MTTSTDLRARDIHDTLVAFYAQLESEPLLAPYFETLDMTAHMPRIVSFWETLLFHTGSYSGNAFLPHLTMPGLTSAHFAKWVATLEAILDALRRSDDRADEIARASYRLQHAAAAWLRAVRTVAHRERLTLTACQAGVGTR
jgi:truncated hemoglobin YjbI